VDKSKNKQECPAETAVVAFNVSAVQTERLPVIINNNIL
jgi:hypothetical protein